MDVISKIFEVSRLHGSLSLSSEHAVSVEPSDIGCQMIGVLHGIAHVTTDNGQTATLGRGDVCFTRNRATVALSNATDDGQPARVLHGPLSCNSQPGNRLMQALPSLMKLRNESPVTHVLRNAMLQRLLSERDDTGAGKSAIAGRMLDILLLDAFNQIMAEKSLQQRYLAALADRKLSPAIEAMHRAPSEPWGLDKLADIAGLSRTAFAIQFKSTVGIPPLQYLMEWRMTLATERLHRKEETIAAIAHDLGYASESAFYKAFKRVHGDSPRAYIK
ncbi:MAG: AraC family transcriptional regulator [Pseudomonadota bacterium]